MLGLPPVDAESEFDTKDRDGLHKKQQVIVLLKNASLESIKTKKGYELACADTHSSILKKLSKNAQAGDYRPDILHRCLLSLLDSPLNKSGHLKVYIETCKHVLIEVNPKVRIPRTFRRFAGLMVQLLHKLKIRASNNSQILLRVIKNPITNHVPPECTKVLCSVSGELVSLQDFAVSQPDDKPIMYVVGAHAHGMIDAEYAEKTIAVSQYGLAASAVLARICAAHELKFGVL